jgi:hypothetical protein
MNYIASDYWKLYESIILKEKQIQLKKETFTVEGIQPFIQTLFGKNETKTKVLFQKDGNVDNINSFLLFMHYRNGTLNIFK